MQPDGIVAEGAWDLEWVRTNCVPSPDGRSASYTAAWLELPPASVRISWTPDIHVGRFAIERSMRVQLDATATTVLTATVSIRMDMNVSVGDSMPAHVTGGVVREFSEFPAVLAADVRPRWQGALESTVAASAREAWANAHAKWLRRAPAPFVYDVDLFDGAPAAVMTALGPVPGGLTDDAMRAQLRLGNAHLRVGPMAAVSLAPSSVRPTFLPLDRLPLVRNSTGLVGGTMLTADGSAHRDGALLHARAKCNGLSDCGSIIAEAMRDMIGAVAVNRSLAACPNASIVPASLASMLSMGFFLNADVVVPRSFSAATHALFRCGPDQGSMLFVTARANCSTALAWPRAIFLSPNDTRAPGALVKSLRLHSAVSAGGVLGQSDANGVITVLAANMRGPAWAGVPMRDVMLTTPEEETRLDSLLTRVADALHTGQPTVDAEIDRRLAAHNASAWISEYRLYDPQPTRLRFLRWFAGRQAGLRLFPSSDGQNATISLQLHVHAALSALDAAVADADAALAAAGRLVAAQLQLRDVNVTSLRLATAMEARLVAGVSATLTVTALSSPMPSVGVPAQLQWHARTVVRAQFAAAPRTLFTCANISYANSMSTAASVTACLNPAIGADVARVGVTPDGVVVKDATVDAPTFARQLRLVQTSVAASVAKNGTIDLLGVSWTRLNATLTWTDLVGELARTADRAPQRLSVFDLAARFEACIGALGSREDTWAAALTAAVYPIGADEVRFIITSYPILAVSIASDNTPWVFNVALDALSLPTLFEIRLNFSMRAERIAFGGVVVRCNADLTGWAVPVAYGMAAGWPTETRARASIGLPESSASYALQLQVALPDINRTLFLLLTGSGGDANSDRGLNMSVTGDTITTVTPRELMSAMAGGLVRAPAALLASSLNVAVPPLNASLGTISAVSSAVDRTLEDIEFPGASLPLLALGNITLDTTQPWMRFNATINEALAVSCEAALDMRDADTLSASANAGLRVCHLDVFFVMDFSPATSDGTPLMTVSLLAATPGILWSVAFESTGGLAIPHGFWIDSPMPIYATWSDFAWVNRLLFAPEHGAYARPTLTWLDVTGLPDVVPPALIDVYGTRLPAMAWSFALDTVESQTNATALTSLQAGDRDVQWALGGRTSRVELALTTTSDVFVVFGAPPLGGAVNISVITDLVNGTANVSVPPAPNNTFTLVLQVERRNTSLQVETLHYAKHIELPAGMGLLQAMQEHLLAVIDAPYRAMLRVGVAPAVPAFGMSEQIRINVSRLQADPHTWLVPVMLSIENSTLPYLQNCTNAPLNMRLVASKTRIQVVGRALAHASSSNGSVGIVAAHADSFDVRNDFAINVQLNRSLLSMPRVMMALSQGTRLFPTFTVQLRHQAVSNTSALSWDLDHVDFGDSAPALSFWSQSQSVANSLDELNGAFGAMQRWRSAFVGGVRAVQAAERLAAVNGSSPCTWLSVAVDAVRSVQLDGLAAPNLPFSGHSFGGIVDAVLAHDLSGLRNSVCANDQTVTLGVFCSVARDTFEQSICARSTLSAANLVLSLNVVRTATIKSAFQFATGSFYREIRNVPVGIGAVGDLALETQLNATLQLVADFSHVVPILHLGGGTAVQLDVSFGMSGNLRARFGPLTATFASAKITLGQPATLTAQLSSPSANALRTVVTGTAALDARLDLTDALNCQVHIAITDLGRFLRDPHDPRGTVVRDMYCDEGLIGELDRALLKISMLDYFLDPNVFVEQFREGLNALGDELFGPNGLVGPILVPLIDHLLTDAISRELSGLLGPSMAMRFISDISQMTSDMITHRSRDDASVQQDILNAFTDILCGALRRFLVACPAPPKAGDSTKTWPLSLAWQSRHPIAGFNVHLGNGKFASFNAHCAPELLLTMSMQFSLLYEDKKGFRVVLSTSPFLSADAQLDYTGCDLDGNFGLLAAQITASGVLDAKFLVPVQAERLAKPTLSVSAHLAGDLDIGFAEWLNRLLLHQDAINAFVNWRGTVLFEWSWTFAQPVLMPRVTMQNMKLCLGQVLAHMLHHFADEAGKVLRPFDSALGRHSILQRRVAATKFLFGHEMTLVALLQEVSHIYCSDSCVFENVVETLDTFVEVLDLFDAVVALSESLAESDNDGCGVVQLIQDFIVDFRERKPYAQPVSPAPDPQLHFVSKWAVAHQSDLTRVWRHVSDRSRPWSLQWVLLENIPEKIVQLILGEDVPLVRLTLPPMTIALGATWYIPIWGVPPIALFASLNARLSVDFQAIVYTSRGIRNVVATRSPGAILTGLALPLYSDTGAVLWPLQGSVSLRGGVIVTIIIFSASASAGVEFRAQYRLQSINDDRYIYFDEVWWMVRKHKFPVVYEYSLTASFGLQIRACVHLWFVHHCWTLANLHVSDPLWHESGGLWGSLPSVASRDGVFHLDTLQQLRSDSQPVVVRVYTDAGGLIMSMSPSDANAVLPQQSRTVAMPSIVGYDGSLGGASATFMISSFLGLMHVPPSPAVGIVVDLSTYGTLSEVTLTSATVLLSSANGVTTLPGQCRTVEIANFRGLTRFAATGVPCYTLLGNTPSTNVSCSGRPQDYRYGPLVLGAAASSVSVALAATQMTVSERAVLADALFNLTSPVTVPLMQVSGDPVRNATYTVLRVGAQWVYVTGGTGNDAFVVRNISDVTGMLELNGGGGINTIAATLYVRDGGMRAIMGRSSVQVSEYNRTHSVVLKGVQVRSWTVQGRPNARMSAMVVQPQDDTDVLIASVGDAGAVHEFYVTGCDPRASLQFTLTRAGTHRVILGNVGTIQDMSCTVVILGSDDPAQTVDVSILAAQDARPLRWRLEANTVWVYDPSAAGVYFRIIHRDVDLLRIESGNGTARFDVLQTTPGTELLLVFPNATAAPIPLVINGTRSGVLVSGAPTTLDIGAWGEHPLRNLGAPLAIVGNATVRLASATGAQAPAQYFRIDRGCVNVATPSGGRAPPPATHMTPRLCRLVQSAGLDASACDACALSVRAVAALSVSTGDATDGLFADRAACPVQARLAGGLDYVYWTNTTATAWLDVGNGPSICTLGAPMSTTDLLPATDGRVASVTIYRGRTNPSVAGQRIGPLGPDPRTDWLTIRGTLSSVDVAIVGGNPPAPVPALARSDVAVVDRRPAALH